VLENNTYAVFCKYDRKTRSLDLLPELSRAKQALESNATLYQ
jgi:hypothetical protein